MHRADGNDKVERLVGIRKLFCVSELKEGPDLGWRMVDRVLRNIQAGNRHLWHQQLEIVEQKALSTSHVQHASTLAKPIVFPDAFDRRLPKSRVIDVAT